MGFSARCYVDKERLNGSWPDIWNRHNKLNAIVLLFHVFQYPATQRHQES